MDRRSRIAWLAYAGVAVGFIGLLTYFEARDRDSLIRWLETGGWVESLPFAIAGLALLSAIALTIRLVRTKRSAWGWLIVAGLFVGVMGEESHWGQETVLGVEAPFTKRAADLHGLVQESLDDDLSSLRVRYLLPLAFSITGLAALLGFAAYRGYAERLPTDATEAEREASKLAAGFLIVGLVLFVAAQSADLLDASSYFRFGDIAVRKWAFEEGLEVLGSVAFLFGALARWTGEFPSTRRSLRG